MKTANTKFDTSSFSWKLVLLLGIFSLAHLLSPAQNVTFLGTGSTIPMADDRLVVVQICHFGDITGVTWNGMAMAKGVSQHHSLAGAVDMWYLPVSSGAEINGTGAVLSGTDLTPRSIHVMSFAGVDQNASLGDTDGAQSGTVTVDATAGDMLWEGYMFRQNTAITGNSGQTEVFDNDFNLSASRCWGAYKLATDGSNSLSCSAGSNGAHAAIVLNKVCAEPIECEVCPDMLSVTSLYLANDPHLSVFHAAQTLDAAGTITTGEDIDFKAGQSIELLVGFTVDIGGILDLIIEECIE